MFEKHAFKGGVHPQENKLTREFAIKDILDIESVRIPMNMQIGAPCKPIVKSGDHVDIGQKIGEPSGIAVPIHATVSGKVKSVKKELMGTGDMVEIIEIENDFQNTWHESIAVPNIVDRDSFIKAVTDSGMVGLGGAGFPTHIKMKPPKDKYPDLVLVNGMECEPYITSDERQMLEKTEEIVEGLGTVLKYMEIPKAIIGIEANKPEAAKKVTEAIAASELKDKVEVKVMPVRYPQGAEKTMIQAVTGRVIPAGGLPHDVNVMVLNVGTVIALNNFFKNGKPLTHKVITLSGDAVNTPGNYRVPIGSRISTIIEKTGGLKADAKKILMGGPMMGLAISDINTPVVKNNNAILVFNKGAVIPEESACIKCGRCVRSCPMQLMPTELDMASRLKDFERMDEFAIMNCVECGACTYVCPAKRHLVQNIRLGKIFYRQGLDALKKAKEAKN